MNGLRMYRRRAGLTLEGLAEASGVSVAAIWNAEAGRTSPSVTTLERLAKPLGVSVAEIVYANEVMGRRQAVEKAVEEYALAGA